MGKPIMDFVLPVAIVLCLYYVIIFSIGQFASIITRSVVLPMFYTFFGLFLGFWWGMYVMEVNGMGRPWMSRTFGDIWYFYHTWLIVLVFLPMILSFFVASRLRISDLMRDRPLRASWRKLTLTFGGALVLSTVLLAVVRLSTVPTASLGYQIDPWVLKQKIDYNANAGKRTNLQFTLTRSSSVAEFQDVLKELRAMAQNPLLSAGESYYYSNEVPLFNELSARIMQDDVTPEFLQEAIVFLEKAPEGRVPATVRVQRCFERHYHNLQTGYSLSYWNGHPRRAEMIWYWTLQKISPWEKTRAKRFLDYRFQTDSMIAEQSERLIFQHDGDARYLAAKINDTMGEISGPLYAEYPGTVPVTPYTFYEEELTRRVAILQAALRLWFIEHGELPATLDDLRGDYLTEVPLAPFYDKPFVYVPKPEDGEILAAFGTPTMYVEHVQGTPYLATTIDYDFPIDYAFGRDANNRTFVFDLPFAMKWNISRRDAEGAENFLK
jgi:energy-converting hydrogenase Eha subunit A